MRALEAADLVYIVMAARWTLLLSAVAFLGGGVGGLLIALSRTGKYKWLRVVSAGYIKLFQGTPLLMQLFLAFFVPGLFAWSVDPWAAAALGLSLHASAFLGEIVRRQNIRHNSRRRLAECGPRLWVDVMRRACGVASADAR